MSVSQRQRTDLTLQFNARMKAYCEREGVPYVDLDRESLGPDGLVHSRLLNADPKDHHYDRRRCARLVARGLKREGIL